MHQFHSLWETILLQACQHLHYLWFIYKPAIGSTDIHKRHWGKTRAQNQAFKDDLPIEHLEYRGSLAWMKDHHSVILSHLQQWKMGICRWIYKCTTPDPLDCMGSILMHFQNIQIIPYGVFFSPDIACSFLRLWTCFFSPPCYFCMFFFLVQSQVLKGNWFRLGCSLHFTSALHHYQPVTFLTFSLFLQLAKQTWEANPLKDLRTDAFSHS